MDIILLLTGVAMVLAIGIGANDETFAPVVGSKKLTINQAVILGSVVLTIGALVLGKNVAKTVGSEISKVTFDQNDVIIILFSVALLLILSSWKGLPISTTHAMVGSTVALALILTLEAGTYGSFGDVVQISVITNILIAWVISPLLGLAGSYVIMLGILKLKRAYIKGLDDVHRIEFAFANGLLVAVVITAFSRGANDVSNAIAPILPLYNTIASDTGSSWYSSIPLLLGGTFMSVGLIVMGRNVLRTLGNDVVELSPTTALSVQASTAVITFVAASLALPISGTHVLVSAFVGTGLAAKSNVNMATIKKIALSALGTPFFAGISTFIFWSIMRLFA